MVSRKHKSFSSMVTIKSIRETLIEHMVLSVARLAEEEGQERKE